MGVPRPNQTQELLLEAAVRLFGERGYEAVSTRELAEAAGVNLGAIQYHFGSKARLFIETVRHLMLDAGGPFKELAEREPPRSRLEAGQQLYHFISSFIAHLFNTEEPRGCRMMCREALSCHSDDGMFEELVRTVVEDFMSPFHQSMIALLKVLAPQEMEEKLALCAHSIGGQCTVYASHRPFLETLHNKSFDTTEEMRALSEHICTFSLRGLQCEEDFIKKVIAAVRERKSS